MGDSRERYKTRSSKYQFLLLEIVYANEMMSSFENDDSIYKRLNPFAYNEDIASLEDQLKKEFWRIAEENLTKRQFDVIKLYCCGMTQQEIAKKLGVNQSSITKSLNGNVDYKGEKRNYGGSLARLRMVIEKDDKIQNILKQIADLRDDNWL